MGEKRAPKRAVRKAKSAPAKKGAQAKPAPRTAKGFPTER